MKPREPWTGEIWKGGLHLGFLKGVIWKVGLHLGFLMGMLEKVCYAP